MNDELKRILRMVAEKKITPEDAARLIEALEPGRRRDKGIFTFIEEMEDVGKIATGKKILRFPAKRSIDIKGMSGDISIEGRDTDQITLTGGGLLFTKEDHNRIRVKALSGDLKAVLPHRIDLSLSSASGDVEISDLEGELQLKVAAGDLMIREFAGRIEIGGVFGDLDLDLKHLEDGKIKAVFGEMVIGLPDEDIEVEVRLKKGGRIKNEAGLEVLEEKRNSFRGRLGKGTHQLRIEGKGGKVILKRR
ncbi:hypothetical protein DRP53_03435 [candidate division WOR-3 bacterium]|uniref:Uncharacterized protein n=1 Tax=candidate division WOR-3 bacterium TaxID=2052148 RepID=A0A660SJN1_UNCW3|nr:MAG: hypothetical protein DRP53_03435 [candidate division WOR-3 bacterium]